MRFLSEVKENFKKISFVEKLILVFAIVAMCFQRVFLAAGSVSWGISIVLSIWLLYQKYKNGSLQNLILENFVLRKHLRFLGTLVIVMLWGIIFTDDIVFSVKIFAEVWLYRTFPFIIATLALQNKVLVKFALLCFGVSLSADCCVALYQHIVVQDGIGWGFRGHHNNLAAITTFVAPVLLIMSLDDYFEKRERVIASVGTMFVLIGVYATGSRSAWIIEGLLLTLLSLPYVFKDKKKILALVLVLVCVGGVFMSSPKFKQRLASSNNTETNYSNIGRLHMWNIAMYVIKDHPLGVGIGRYEQFYNRDYDPIYATPKDAKHIPQPHNEYLTIWAECGPLSILVYLFACISMLYFNFKRWITTRIPYPLMMCSSWLAFMLYGLFDSVINHSSGPKILWFVLGCLLTLENYGKGESNDK